MNTYPHLAEALSKVIEILRKEKKMTKSSLADFACLQRRYLLAIEQGTKKPTVNAVYSICSALGVPPLEFFRLVTLEIERLEQNQAKRPPAEDRKDSAD